MWPFSFNFSLISYSFRISNILFNIFSTNVLQNSCSKRFRKIRKKTIVTELFFSEVSHRNLTQKGLYQRWKSQTFKEQHFPNTTGFCFLWLEEILPVFSKQLHYFTAYSRGADLLQSEDSLENVHGGVPCS